MRILQHPCIRNGYVKGNNVLMIMRRIRVGRNGSRSLRWLRGYTRHSLKSKSYPLIYGYHNRASGKRPGFYIYHRHLRVGKSTYTTVHITQQVTTG